MRANTFRGVPEGADVYVEEFDQASNFLQVD